MRPGPLVLALALPATAFGQTRPDSAAPLIGFDHVVIAVGDLTRAGADFSRLGFALKPGRPHANGITNLHVKFRSGTEIELLSVPAGVDRPTRYYRESISRGDGPAAVALFPADYAAVPRVLAGAGLVTGPETDPIGFPDGHPLRDLFFWHRNHSPTDRPEHFAHPNTADSVVALWVAATETDPFVRLLRAFGAADEGDVEPPFPGGRARVQRLADIRVLRFPPLSAGPGRRVIGLTLHVRSVARAREVLERAAIPFTARRSPLGGDRLYLSPEQAHGLWLELTGRGP